MKNLALEIKNIWKLSNVSSHLSGSCGHQKLPKISKEYRFNKSGAKSRSITNVSY